MFRTLTMSDLELAAGMERLWEGPGGWALGSIGEDEVEIGWVETGEDDAGSMMRALADLAGSTGAGRLVIWLPEVAWLVDAARRTGCEVHPMGVYAIAL
jgi:hypothetical protein